MKLLLLGLFSAVAFAGNSLLNRAGLVDQYIDPMSFALIRVLSAALFLWLMMRGINISKTELKAKIFPAVYLALYLICFSLAYVQLGSATGALILFAVVQFVLVGYSYVKGYRLSAWEWLGISIAFIGTLVLLLPGADRPSIIGFILMSLAGVGWALFTLVGLSSKNAIVDVSLSFLIATPLVVLAWLLSLADWYWTTTGVLLALTSGIVASGLGYYLWFLLLPNIAAVSAAALQLSVPALVAVLGILFLAEAFSLRLLLAIVLILTGLALFSVVKLRRS